MVFQKAIRGLSTSILGGAFIIALTSIVSRVLGLFRDRLLAGTFGGSGTLDPYFAAFKVPDFIFNVLVLGALSSSFVPVFISYIKKKDDIGKDEAWRIANSILNLLIIILTVLGVLFYILAPYIVPLIAPGFSAEKEAITLDLSRVMLIAIIFFGISNVISGILNSFKLFLSFAFAPVMYNLGIIFGILVLTPKYGIMGLAYGVVFGAALHLVIQLPSVFRAGFRYRAICDMRHPGVRRVGSLMLPRTFGLAVNQIDVLISTIIASTLAAGSITVINFANNLQNFPINVFGVSLAIAAFPSFSEAIAENDHEKFRRHFSQTVRRILYMMIPVSVLILLLRAQIVRIIVGAETYSWTATYLTAQVLGLFAISLFAQAIIPTLARSFYAHQDTRTPVKVGLVAVAVNIVCSLIFSRMWGVFGLAASFSLSQLVNMFLLYALLRKKMGQLDDGRILQSGIKIVTATAAMAIAVIATKYIVAGGINMHTFMGIFLQGLIAGGVGIVSYVIMTILLGSEEVAMIRTWIAKFRKQAKSQEPVA